ncbi:MAG: hypothetical protein LBS40_06010 [Burkholderiales bacterium]|jgi:hypothetical protein|nr:hypothetical protein [Burkholderiales bacterium]
MPEIETREDALEALRHFEETGDEQILFDGFPRITKNERATFSVMSGSGNPMTPLTGFCGLCLTRKILERKEVIEILINHFKQQAIKKTT